MKKRLTRVFANQLSGNAPAVLPQGIPLHVVLKTGDTLMGDLIEQNPSDLLIRDRRFHRHVVALAQVEVVVFDYPSSW